ncbi:hypothetical protein M2273_000029 [Mucilaginibacter lappiensis]
MMAASATDKISESEHALEMTKSFGITLATYRILGIIELLSVILFAVPRTSILGILLLSSYLEVKLQRICGITEVSCWALIS